MTAAIAKPLGHLLFYIYQFVGNYGLAIIILTILIRLILYPLTANQLKHSKRLQDVQPKIQELQKKHANDKETLNQKIMELYKEEKVNPAGGCLPMLIQMPIILGLFALLKNPVDYISNPSMLQAIHESFLWIPDLSHPDKWILPILAGVTTYFSFSMTSNMGQSSEKMKNPTMKMMQYIFPVMIVWWGHGFPAGLTLYWFISTLAQLGQQYIINKTKTS